MIITIKDNLESKELPTYLENNFNRRYENKLLTNNINPRNFILNYLEYLEICWACHRGAILSPDIFWYILLTELANDIKNNPKQYQKFFTTKDEKQEISVFGCEVLDLNAVLRQLKGLVPFDIDKIMPKFTTTGDFELLAFQAAFCDAVSPYYNYCTFACGIPQIKVIGTQEDWLKISCLAEELKVFERLKCYLHIMADLANNIASSYNTPDINFWKDFFYVKRCGSGSQYELKGWVTKFFMTKPRLALAENFPTQISQVKYTNKESGKNYIMNVGLFSFEEDESFLIPKFGYVVLEDK